MVYHLNGNIWDQNYVYQHLVTRFPIGGQQLIILSVITEGLQVRLEEIITHDKNYIPICLLDILLNTIDERLTASLSLNERNRCNIGV